MAISDLPGKPITTAAQTRRPASLMKLTKSRNLPEADVGMLAGIRSRGGAPRTAERWQFIQAIKNSAPMDR